MENNLEVTNYWLDIGEEGKTILEILQGVNFEDDDECFAVWKSYLERKLEFPFDSLVNFSEDNWEIKTGDKIKVNKLLEIDEMNGILIEGVLRFQKIDFPLCNLAVKSEKSNNAKLVKAYRAWYSNR